LTRTTRSAASPRASASAAAGPPSECATTARTRPCSHATSVRTSARSGRPVNDPSDSPCAGWSNATTRRPSARSARTTAYICTVLPPQPCTSNTAGRSGEPHDQVAMRRPRWVTQRARASRKADRRLAGPGERGGVWNRRSAHSSARPGASRDEVPSAMRRPNARSRNRTFAPVIAGSGSVRRIVDLPAGLAGNSAQARSRRLAGLTCDQRGQRSERADASALVAEQATVMVADQRDPEALEHELLDIGVAAEMAFFDRAADCPPERLHPFALERADAIADRPGLIVELDGGAEHDAAPGKLRRLGPVEPVGERRAQPRHPARLRQGGDEHRLAELLAPALEHRELQLLARAEMREQARLRHPGRRGERADREALEPELARDPHGLVEDRGARLLAFGQPVHAR